MLNAVNFAFFFFFFLPFILTISMKYHVQGFIEHLSRSPMRQKSVSVQVK